MNKFDYSGFSYEIKDNVIEKPDIYRYLYTQLIDCDRLLKYSIDYKLNAPISLYLVFLKIELVLKFKTDDFITKHEIDKLYEDFKTKHHKDADDFDIAEFKSIVKHLKKDFNIKYDIEHDHMSLRYNLTTKKSVILSNIDLSDRMIEMIRDIERCIKKI